MAYPCGAIARWACIVIGTTVLAGCFGSSSDDPTYRATIRRTTYGVPHIEADTLKGGGYGVAYAYAQDNFCLLADQILTVSGERSKYLGPDASAGVGSGLTNLKSDFYFQYVLADDFITATYGNLSPDAQQLADGYIAGYNRYLKDTGVANLPAACKGADWVRPITKTDYYKVLHEKVLYASSGSLSSAILEAAPPGPAGVVGATTTPSPRETAERLSAAWDQRLELGSNAYAIGKDASENGSGILLGNPHFPWLTTYRFYQFHLTVANDVDVMGAALGGFPLINIGFNNNVAWSHTVSTARRFTLFELAMQGATSYVIDGVVKPLIKKTVSVQAKKADGTLETRTHDFYASEFGPLLNYSGLIWTASKAFALKDANLDNSRMFDQWLRFARASNVADIKSALLEVNGLPWVNTIAADRAGAAMYADISVTPYVTQAKLAACVTTPTGQAAMAALRLFMLDGSKSSCDWDRDAVSGRQTYPTASMPAVLRSDYVANSNDSAWLANPNQLNNDLPLIIGPTAVAQTLRTRMAFTQIQDRLSGADGKFAAGKFNPSVLESIFFDSRSQAAEMTVDALVALCSATPSAVATSGNTVNLSAACTTLAAWNKRMTQQAVGVPVFREFWRTARSIPSLWAVPFNAADPIRTPRDLNVNNAVVRAALLKALADAVELTQARGISLSTPLAAAQFTTTAKGARLPLDSGDEFEGTFNKITPAAGLTPLGYTPIVSGSSHVQIVTWNADGPVARGILTYSQSTNPDSPYSADQTAVFSASKFVKLPFLKSEILADPNLSQATIEE